MNGYAAERQRDEEQRLLESVTQTGGLISVSELAKGVVYTEPIITGNSLCSDSLMLFKDGVHLLISEN
jgi:hypothetical protein